MPEEDLVFASDCLSIGSPRPCAEDPNLVQLSGSILKSTLADVDASLSAAGWRTLRMGNPETLVGRLPTRELIIVDATLGYDLSRVSSIEAGTEMLRRLFDPGYASQEKATP